MTDRTPDELLDGLGAELRAAAPLVRRRPSGRARIAAVAGALIVAAGTATVATGGPWAPAPPASLDTAKGGRPAYVLDGGGAAWWRLSVRTCRRGGATWPVASIRVADGGAGRSCTTPPPGPQVETYVDVPRDRTLVFAALPADATTLNVTLRDGTSTAAPAVAARQDDGRRYAVAELRGVRELGAATVAGRAGTPLARCDADGTCR